MGNPGAPRPLMDRYSRNPMLPRQEPDDLDRIEVRKEVPMKEQCTAEGCDRPAIAKGLCRLHYDRARAAAQPKRSESPRKPATPREFHGLPEEPIQVLPHKGKLYLLAEIRVMTEEKLREMVGG